MPYDLLDEEPGDKNASDLLTEDYEDLARQTGRQASNLLTLGVGLSGDIFSLINDFIANPAVGAFGGEKVPYEKTALGKLLPTTETHRKNLEPYTGEYLKPQNEVEKFTDNVVETTAELFNPANLVKTGVKTGTKLMKSLFKSVGANLAGETAKQVSNSEGAGTATKIGSLFILSLMDKESAAKQVGKLYREAENWLPPGSKTQATKLNSQLNALDHSITKGRPVKNLSPPEKFVINQSKKVRKLIKKGEISVEQTIAQKRSLNQELATLYKEVPGFKEQKKVRNMAKQLNGFLNETIGDYGKTNPKFYAPYKNADEAFGTLAKSNFISHWVGNNVVQHPVTTGLMHLFGPIAKTTAVAAFPYHATKLLYRIGKSPTLAKIYGKATAAAAKEDAVAFNKYLKELDDSLQEEESKDAYEFID